MILMRKTTIHYFGNINNRPKYGSSPQDCLSIQSYKQHDIPLIFVSMESLVYPFQHGGSPQYLL
jgi:hypothetical protein